MIDKIEIKEIIENSQNAAFLLGTTMGSIGIILDNMKHGLNSEAEENLRNLYNELTINIGKLYYNKRNS